MTKNIFISTVHEDSEYIAQLKDWIKNKLLGEVNLVHETQDKRHEGSDAIRKYIKEKIKDCQVLFVLIGNDTHNHEWITIETELANSFHLKIICSRIPNTVGSPPLILKKYQLVDFKPLDIKNALDMA